MSTLPPDAPRIGLELRLQERSPETGTRRQCLVINASYYQSIRRAGGRPILLPPFKDDALALLELVDGLVLSGGADVHASRYGEPANRANEPMPPEQDEEVFALVAAADRKALPVLGVCLGAQVMNVHRGGSLHQHLPEAFAQSPINHSQDHNPAVHGVQLATGRLLESMGQAPASVTSRHHQAVKKVGDGLRAVAHAPDGVIEAIEDPGRPFFIGVQWHCEDMPDDAPTQQLLATLVQNAREYAAKRR